MKSLIVAGLVFLLSLAAHAQTALPVTPGYLSTDCLGSAEPCFVPAGSIHGFGTLSVTATSALVSTLATGPNSSVWPTKPGVVQFINTGTTPLFFCPLGGTCATTTGIPIAAGATVSIFQPSANATVVASSTGALTAEW